MGCSCCGLILNSCSTAPITERKQFKIVSEAKLNAQAAQIYEKVKKKEKLITDSKFFLIKQRETNDIWEKLYELPLIESKSELNLNTLESNNFLNQFNIDNIKHQYKTIHILSHRKYNRSKKEF